MSFQRDTQIMHYSALEFISVSSYRQEKKKEKRKKTVVDAQYCQLRFNRQETQVNLLTSCAVPTVLFFLVFYDFCMCS